MRKIKVLHISQATGGVQRHVIDIVSRMDKNIFEVTGVCPPQDLVKGVSLDKESFLRAFERSGAAAHPIKMHREIRPLGDLAAFVKIYRFIKKEGFDVVHAHSSKAGFLARIAARMAGVPVIIYTPNNFAFDRPPRMVFHRTFFGLLEKFAGLFCDMVFAVCRDELELAVRLGILPREKVTLISNTADISSAVSAADVSAKRRELGIGESEKIVISVGRLAAQKAPLEFLKAARQVLEKYKDARFLFLGDGPLAKKAADFISRRGLADRVKLLGWRDDAAAIIAASDIFVLSSSWEVLPNHSLLDALALGKPAVITAVSGASDVVINGYNGYIAPVGDHVFLARRILGLLALPAEDLRIFGRHSREIVEKRPAPADITRTVENTYMRLLFAKGALHDWT